MTAEERRAMTARRDPKKVRAADRARYERDKPKRRTAMDAWHAAHPERVREHKAAYVERNSEKRHAHITLDNAVRDGKITREPCLFCDSPDTHGHHHDYRLPLVVSWLCPTHHGLVHRNEREMARGAF
jgi:hypothetical protein